TALTDPDSARRGAHSTHVPSQVFFVLFVYFAVTAAVLGYVLTGTKGRMMAGFLLALMVLSLMLILDIDRPNVGTVRESQAPMEILQKAIAGWPPGTFDR